MKKTLEEYKRIGTELSQEWGTRFNSDEFKKYILRQTKNDYWYTFDNKRFNTYNEACAYLKKNFKVAEGKIKTFQEWGGTYAWFNLYKVVKKDDVIYILRFYKKSGVKTLRFETKSWIGTSVILQDGSCIQFYEGGYYRSQTYQQAKPTRSFVPNLEDDIDAVGTFLVPTAANNYQRRISSETKNLLTKFFMKRLDETMSGTDRLMDQRYSPSFWEQIVDIWKTPRKVNESDKENVAKFKKMMVNIRPILSEGYKLCRKDQYVITIAYNRTYIYDTLAKKKYCLSDGGLMGQGFHFMNPWYYCRERVIDATTNELLLKYNADVVSDCFIAINENGERITATEALKGTPIENLFIKFADKENGRGNHMSELDKDGLIYKSYVGLLYMPKKVVAKYDLMINSGLFYIFNGCCNRGGNLYNEINSDGKSMSSILDMPNRKIRIIENAAQDLIVNSSKELWYADHIWGYLRRWNFLDLKSITDDQFQTIISHADVSDYGGIENLYNALQKPLNTFLDLYFNKKLYTGYYYAREYTDYLNMRKTLKKFQPNFEEHRWPVVPGKMRTTVTLRDRMTQYAWTTNYVIKAITNLTTYINKYGAESITILEAPADFESQAREQHCGYEITDQKPNVGRDDRIIIGLDLDMKGAIRFLHDEIIPVHEVYKDHGKMEDFVTATKRVDRLQYEDEEFSIVIPKKPDDLVVEGKTLGHCVSSFIDPIINGTENVVFLRRNKCKNVPFYTIALSNKGEIEQVHCYRNGACSIEAQKTAWNISRLESYENPVDIMPFLKKWAKDKKLTNVQGRYGALCARR